MFYVRPARAPATATSAAVGSPLCASCAAAAPHALPSQAALSVTPPLKLGRAQTLCPTRTRSSPVAHGRARAKFRTLPLITATPMIVWRLRTAPTVWSGAVWAHARPRPRRRHRRPRRRRPRHLLRTYAAARAAETRSVAAAPACATVSGTRSATRPPARPSCLVSGARSVRRCRPKKSRAELRLVVGA